MKKQIKISPREAFFKQFNSSIKLTIIVLSIAGFLGAASSVQAAANYYIAPPPQGSDMNNGSLDYPFASFAKAFSTMKSGDELILLDGIYSEVAGTGYINYTGNKSAQPPSGSGADSITYIHAKNSGKVKIIGKFFLGSKTRKDSYIKIQGITFEGGGQLYNTSYITIKDCGFHSVNQSAGAVLVAGTNDHENGNSYILFEDVWVWGQERMVFEVYRSDHVVARRVVTRNDGCYSSTLGCGNNTGNQMVGTTIYNSNNVSYQNMIAIDNIPGPNGHNGAGDFYIAWHNNYIYPWHKNEWLGTISLNSKLSSGYGYDIDNIPAAEQPMATYKDIVAWDTPSTFNAQMNCGTGCAAHNLNVSGGTFKVSGGDGFRVSSTLSSGTHNLKNIVALGNGRYGINSAVSLNYADVNGTWSQGAYYNKTTCSNGCLTSDPVANGSIKYITRIEPGSVLKGAGFEGADYGANTVNRYGRDGSGWGDPSYNTLTAESLWPWPNEERIKQEMCLDSGETRGFCSTPTLTKYIWEYLGNPIPPEIYAPADKTPPSIPSALNASAVSSTQINLNWASSTDNAAVTGYKIYRDGIQINTTTDTFYSDNGLTASTNYIYTVSAIDASGNESAQSASVSIITDRISDPIKGTYYISPGGLDTNIGSNSAPFASFAKAFSTMKSGDELILLDGIYSEGAGTGYISYLGNNSAQIPYGINLANMTYVHAKNPGSVIVKGKLFIGRSTRKDSYIKIQGITFEGGGQLYNTSYITIKDCGFHSVNQSAGSVLTVGTGDHEKGNTYNLIEDSWVWGKERVIAINYRADNNVWRRVVIRGDGCGSTSCTGSGNPNVGISVYDSQNVSVQNIIVLDRILGGGSPYADFATAQHTAGAHLLGPAEWLGSVSLKSPDTGFYSEADNANDNTITIKDSIVWNAVGYGFNISSPSFSTNLTRNISLQNLTSQSGGDNFRIVNVPSGSIKNILSYNAGRYGVNSSLASSYADVYGSASGAYNQRSCFSGCLTVNPTTSGLKYITRIEENYPLSKTGSGGNDYGANIIKRYGADGTFFGDINFNLLTNINLWPWPNEERIRKEMCSDSNETRGFCSAQTFTKYIWEYLGNLIPSEIYGTVTDTTAPVTIATPMGGTYTSAQSVTLTANESAVIYYTTDGTTPTAASTVYSVPIVIGLNMILNYFSKDIAGNTEAVKIESYVINIPNNPPALNAIGNKSVDENTILTFTLSGSDLDNDTLTYSAVDLPQGAVLLDNTFTWSPDYAQAGSYNITFIVSDGKDTDTENIAIVVNNVNRPPTINPIGAKSIDEGKLLAFLVFAVDPDGDILTYNATGLPAGATFSNQSFSWTPGYNQSANYSVTFSVSDGSSLTSETVNIAVVDVPMADLILTKVSGPSGVATGTNFSVAAVIKNQGTATASNLYIRYYISYDYSITTSDIPIGTSYISGINPGVAVNNSINVKIPTSLYAGPFYLGTIVDYNNTVKESNESNNALTGNKIAVTPGVDFIMTAVGGPKSAVRGTTISITNTIKNQGMGIPTSTSYVGLYLSKDSVITTSDVRLINRAVGGLAAGDVSTTTNKAVIPLTLAAGTYYLGAVGDYVNSVKESNETNNSLAGNLVVVQ